MQKGGGHMHGHGQSDNTEYRIQGIPGGWRDQGMVSTDQHAKSPALSGRVGEWAGGEKGGCVGSIGVNAWVDTSYYYVNSQMR